MEFKDLKYDSVQIANALLWKAREAGISMNITKLNKMLYIIYGFMLALFKERLTSEHPKAWPYGPVFPRVNKKVNLNADIPKDIYEDLPEDIRKIIDAATNSFGSWTATELSNWSHQPGGPWDITYRTSNKWGSEIDDELIYYYFQQFRKPEVADEKG